MKKLEDILLMLKFDTDDSDYSYGQREALRFCIRKHQEGWTLEDFKQELNRSLSMNTYDGYIQGIISGFKYNIKIMEEIEDEQTSYASTN